MGLPIFAAVAVAIELPPDTTDEAAARVIESCQAALGAGECAVHTDDVDSEWYATVRWEGVRLVVTLEDRQARGTELARRQIEFSASDSEEQRWVAAGLMVAAVTAAQSEPAEADAVDESRVERPEPEKRPLAVVRPPSRPAAWRGAIDVGALVGRGLRFSEPKVGISVRGFLLSGASPWGATASLRAARTFGDPELHWYGGSAGVAVQLTNSAAPFGVEVLGELLVEQAQARATRQDVEQALTSSVRAGGALGVIGSYRATEWLLPWIAADISVVRPELEVRVADETAAREGDMRWAFSLGARFQ